MYIMKPKTRQISGWHDLPQVRQGEAFLQLLNCQTKFCRKYRLTIRLLVPISKVCLEMRRNISAFGLWKKSKIDLTHGKENGCHRDYRL